MSKSGYDINSLVQEAQSRWLKPAEVLFVLQNHDKYQVTQEPPQRPLGGSLFLFNKRVLRFFRKDGHSWRKKKDGRTVGEAHERLKVGNVEALNCYYAHGDQNPSFQRRSYWMLDPAYEHIVLVHYRDVSEGSASSASAQLSPGPSSIFSPSPSSYTTQNQGSAVSSSHQNSASPASVEVSSEFISSENGIESTADFPSSSRNDVGQFLRRLEEQLSLNEDSIKDIDPEYAQGGPLDDSYFLDYGSQIYGLDQSANLQHRTEYMTNNQSYVGNGELQHRTTNHAVFQDLGSTSTYSNSFSVENMNASKESISWNQVLESSSKTSSGVEYQEKIIPSLSSKAAKESEASLWLNFDGTDSRNASIFLPQEVEEFEISAVQRNGTGAIYYPMYEQDQLGVALETDSSLTVSQEQKFTIHDISPEWGYADEATKVIVVGSHLCDPSDSAWSCMFGDTEVPLQIIQDGVFRCEAPPHSPGKVTLCITSGNRESCSQIRTFEYRTKASSCAHCNISETEVTKSPEELLLLVRFAQILLFNSSLQREDSTHSGFHPLRETKADDDSWGHVIEALLDGGGTTSSTVDWLVQQLLQDKLQQWLSSRSLKANKQSETECTLSKKEQGIIHMVAGLGFEWALSPILSHGVSVNFRDINGWTALHWAARFGREKMVAALLASGASAGAVTDPNPQDPIGKSPASIAASSGHKGLAGYLSEVALTSHLSSLTIEESELSKDTAKIEAERTVDGITNENVAANEDQVSLKNTLAAVRNAAQAAARIQSAFRAHSFRKRQEKEAVTTVDEDGITAGEIPGLSALSKKLPFRNARDFNSAALSIQKKYRGWKGRKDFLSFRQKVVKIQAHVRGYQVRKHYKMLWAVGILDKVVLRWRRKGVGLRGFRSETAPIDECEDEDILKVFRKQKVDATIEEAVSRVLSMVDSPDARQQYQRMLQRYRQAKAELSNTSEAGAPSTQIDVSDFQIDVSDLENEDVYFY